MSLTDNTDMPAAVAVEAPDNAPPPATSPDAPEPVTLTDDEIMTQAVATAAAIAEQRDTPPPVESAGRQIEPPIKTVDDRGRTI